VVYVLDPYLLCFLTLRSTTRTFACPKRFLQCPTRAVAAAVVFGPRLAICATRKGTMCHVAVSWRRDDVHDFPHGPPTTRFELTMTIIINSNFYFLNSVAVWRVSQLCIGDGIWMVVAGWIWIKASKVRWPCRFISYVYIGFIIIITYIYIHTHTCILLLLLSIHIH
jgi:hypothetical protein